MPRLHPPDKGQLLHLPPFPGLGLAQVVVPVTDAELDAAWADLHRHRHLGFDTESKPTFVAGSAVRAPDVVQFATPDRAYVLQLRHEGCVDLACAVLDDREIVKVGFDLRQDQAQLRACLDVQADPLIDLDAVFHRQGYPRSIGIKAAVAIVFGQRFVKSKRLTTTNWAQPVLTGPQLLYAANDAWVALQVMLALGPAATEV